MAGFDNDIVYGLNVDFRGVEPVVAQMVADGQLLIGATATPNIRANTLTAGAGIVITNGPGTIQITAAGAGFGWSVVTSATNPNTLSTSNGYIAKGGAQVVFLLPAVAAVGDEYEIVGYGNLWTLTQNAGQTISLNNQTTTAGVGGSVTATLVSDVIQVLCVTANTEFRIINVVGNPSFI